jgi:hypothetical protein
LVHGFDGQKQNKNQQCREAFDHFKDDQRFIGFHVMIQVDECEKLQTEDRKNQGEQLQSQPES